MDTKISGFSFLETMQKAKELPAIDTEVSTGKAVDMPAIFSDIEDAKDTTQYTNEHTPPEKIGIETYYNFKSRVFTLDRPYELCPRCQEAFAVGEVVLPDDGDYTCPHTQLAEYHVLANAALKGDAVIQVRDFYNDIKMVRRVHVEWLEADPTKKKAIMDATQRRAEDAVYPPRPDLVFGQK